MSEKNLKFETYIPTRPEQVYYAFSNASALREWLCDLATVDPRPGGRMYEGSFMSPRRRCTARPSTCP